MWTMSLIAIRFNGTLRVKGFETVPVPKQGCFGDACRRQIPARLVRFCLKQGFSPPRYAQASSETDCPLKGDEMTGAQTLTLGDSAMRWYSMANLLNAIQPMP
jgi:hypothetical protein